MAVPEQQPNIVFILSDDQGPWAAGCYGNEEIRTPNIDRLAERGLRFNNFFCTSPVCSPARASLMTGRLPSQHGIHDWLRAGNMPPDTPAQRADFAPVPGGGAPPAYPALSFLDDFLCYTDVLKEHGYVCGLSGKWHLGNSLVAQHGFSHWLCHQLGHGRYNDAPMVRNGRAVVEPGYVTDVITEDALAFIERNRDAPFYLSVNYTAPHSPWTGHPRDITESYEDCAFKSCPQEPLHPWFGPKTPSCLGNREMLKGYFAATTAMDHGIGRLLAKLDRENLTQNTLVIFSSDNGFSCGHHGFWGKGNGTFPVNMYENSVKVPMIMSHPGHIRAGAATDAMTSQYDFMPTLLGYLGLPFPDDGTFPGRSLEPVLANRTDESQDNLVVYDEYGPVRMIRDPEWKYVQRYPFGRDELYDMVNDPGERKNLIDDSSRQSLVRDFRSRLTAWFGRYVRYEMDGSRFPVSGGGQLTRIDAGSPGENCFQNHGRIVFGEKGFPQLDRSVTPVW